MKITERLAALIIEENMRLREVDAQGTTEFVRAQTEDVRQRIIDYEKSLEDLRAKNGRRPLSQADLSLTRFSRSDTRRCSSWARNQGRGEPRGRMVGEQFKVIDPARLPERPVGPSRLGVNVVGTLAGLGLGLVFVGVRGRSKEMFGETSAWSTEPSR